MSESGIIYIMPHYFSCTPPVKDFKRIHIGVSDTDVWMDNRLGICKGKAIPVQAPRVPGS